MPAMKHRGLSPRGAALLCLLGSAALLITVRVFDALGYVPCPLCLTQRKIHWAAAAVALVALLLTTRPSTARLARIAVVVLAVVYVGSAGYAAYHAGVEYHWWPAPPCQAAAGDLSSLDLVAALNETSRAVPCDQAAWTLFGVSLAGYNVLASLALAAIAALGATSRPRGIFH